MDLGVRGIVNITPILMMIRMYWRVIFEINVLNLNLRLRVMSMYRRI